MSNFKHLATDIVFLEMGEQKRIIVVYSKRKIQGPKNFHTLFDIVFCMSPWVQKLDVGTFHSAFSVIKL